MLLEYSFEPRSKSRALGTASSVMTVGLSINGCSPWKDQFDERKQDWLVQTFGLRRLQKLDVIRESRASFSPPRSRRLFGTYYGFLHEILARRRQKARRLCWQGAESLSVADPEKGPGELAPSPLIFRPNWGPKGWNFFFETAPPRAPLSQSLDDRAPPWKFGSATVYDIAI